MLAIRTLIGFILVFSVGTVAAGQSRSVPNRLRQRIEKLPEKLTQLYRAKEQDLAGSTISMTEALMSIADGLLDDAVTLQSFVTGEQPDRVRIEIQRDQEAIGKSVYIERNAEGWGGTMTSIESAAARLRHVENVISFYVTQTLEKDNSFKLNNWHAAWRKAAKREGE